MNEQFTPELLAKARTVESPEALLALAAESGVTLTPKEAQTYFDQLRQTGELSDEELDNVAGGCGTKPRASVKCPNCGSKDYLVQGRAGNGTMQMRNQCCICGEKWCG